MSPSTKAYFLLEEPLPGHRLFDLLGRAVYVDGNSLYQPTQSIIQPALPIDGPDLKDLVKDLYPKEVEAQDAKMLREKTYGQSAKASISKVLGLFYKHQKLNHKERSIPGFRRVTMEEPYKKISNLLKNDKYNGPIIEFFQQNPEAKFGIIVSIISCFDMQVGDKKAKEREAGGNATIPGEVLGALGGAGDAGFELGINHNNKAELSGTYKDEVVMACGYMEMYLKKPKNGWAFWISHKPSPYDITFTAQTIHPGTMTVSVPPTRLPGDMPAILGGISGSDAEGSSELSNADLPTQDDDGDESDFVLYAECS